MVLIWLNKADEDLMAGNLLLGEGTFFLNVVASQAQQAAEKYLKGYLTWRQKFFPKSHDLKILLNLLAETDPQITSELKEIVKLTSYVITARYAEDISAISLGQAEEAIALAKKAEGAIISALPAEITLRRRIHDK